LWPRPRRATSQNSAAPRAHGARRWQPRLADYTEGRSAFTPGDAARTEAPKGRGAATPSAAGRDGAGWLEDRGIVQEGEGTQTTEDETLVPPGAAEAQATAAGEAVAQPDPLAAAQEEAAQLKDKLLRTLADFDNFRKRSRREVDDARRAGRDHLLKELLPVFDNLERAVEHSLRA